jgi:hypothetical protein
MVLSSFNVVLSWSMVACGTSGLLGGRRVPFPVADNSLISAVPAFAVAFALVVRGFLVVVLALPTRGFLVAFALGFAMILSLLTFCFIFTFYESVFICV